MKNSVKKMKYLLLSCLLAAGCGTKTLPLPEVSEGMRGQLGIDANVNESTIDQYLGREDSVYRDMRMLADDADYEAIGGDSYLSGYVKGFEVVPYPYLCNVEGLPEEVGESYTGTTLFTHEADGSYTANYEESMHILEGLFPKDKTIFLMCGGGGYAGMTKNMLVSLGWDETKIYNTGGYWYYEGENRVVTTYEEDGRTYYDFSSVPYHPIEFASLTPVSSGADTPDDSGTAIAFTKIADSAELKRMQEEQKTFALYLYLPGCVSCASFYPVVKEYADANQIEMYSTDLSVLISDTNAVTEKIDYAPSMFIFKDGEVIAYLDAESDDDLKYFENAENLGAWFDQHIDISELKTDDSECTNACHYGG